MRDGVRLEDGDRAGAAAPDQLVGEAALADSGVGDDGDDPALALEGTRERRVELP